MSIIERSNLFPALSEILFADKEPELIEQEVITLYENLSGRTLTRADPVRLFLESIILVIIQQRNLIDFTGKMNLLAYSSGEFLEHLGALLGVSRLEPTGSVCTMEFSLPSPQNSTIIIPAHTRISAGNFIFATLNETEILPGSLSTQVTAQSITTGADANNLLPGQVNNLVDVLPWGITARNITETNGGSDRESDENFRERIHLVPESFTNAGSKKGYEFHARSAHKDIISCEVLTPPDTSPGFVEIYPLMTGGELPSDEIIKAVYEACNGETVRPDTDFVSVKKPKKVNFNIDFSFWIDENSSNLAAQIHSKVEEAVNEFIAWQRKILGRDINPSELNYRIIQAGAKRCEIREPEFKVLKRYEVAVCNSKNIIYAGLEEN